MKILILLLSCCIFLPIQAEKKYDMIWLFRKGLVNIMPQKLEITNTAYLLKNGKKKKVAFEKAKVTNTIHWKIENVINNSQALIVNLVRDGKIKVTKNGKTSTLSMKNPLKNMKKALLPPFNRYQALSHGGMAFLLDLKKQEVTVTWILHIKKDGTYRREMVKGQKDPHGMTGAHRQLINQRVAIGTEWDIERTDMRGFTYKNHYVFEKITKYKGKSVGKVVVSGKIFLGSVEIGKVKGYYFHDYRKRLMRFLKMEEHVEQIVEQKGKNGEIKKHLLDILFKYEWYLKKTNAKLK